MDIQSKCKWCGKAWWPPAPSDPVPVMGMRDVKDWDSGRFVTLFVCNKKCADEVVKALLVLEPWRSMGDEMMVATFGYMAGAIVNNHKYYIKGEMIDNEVLLHTD